MQDDCGSELLRGGFYKGKALQKKRQCRHRLPPPTSELITLALCSESWSSFLPKSTRDGPKLSRGF